MMSLNLKLKLIFVYYIIIEARISGLLEIEKIIVLRHITKDINWTFHKINEISKASMNE